ncbi:recombinase family protein [Granulicella arctica]|uniref:recombinase family protein n=1 Tax=Granulicella arctica TaxID=940613 RepID=UPI0021E0CBE7|nr:recombinase family protein [Granulicella arctica]
MRKPREPISTKKSARRAGKGLQIGYLRVSAVDQSELRQLEGLKLDKTFTDKASGKDVHRPQFELLLSFIREGDTLICHSMDRLARNLDDLRRIVLELTRRGVHVQFRKEQLTFTGEDSPMANLLLSVMGAFAQFERELIRERQREGIALAKKRGAYVGRKRALTPVQAVALLKRVADGESKAALARELGLTRDTVYRYMRRGTQDKPAGRRGQR